MRWKVSRLFPNYQILSTKSRFLALQSLDILKLSAQSLQTRNLQGGTEFLLQNVENGGCHQIFAIFRGTCRLENLQKTLFYWRNLLKLSVVLQDNGCFLGIEIGFFSLLQGLHRLRIKLLIVQSATHVYRSRQFYSQETAVAGWVGKNIGHVARGDEGGETGELLDMTAIWRLDFHRWQLQQILQKALLNLWRNLVELIEIDKQKL